MPLNAVLEVEDNILATLDTFLRGLLEHGVVEYLLVPQATLAGDNVVQTLVHDMSRLQAVNPVAPVLPVNSAKLVSKLTVKGAPRPVGVVLRTCELRALVELVKLQQASLENVTVIVVDCLGTYEVADYAALVAAGCDPTAELLAQVRDGDLHPHGGYSFRAACQMCEYPVPDVADVHGPDIHLGLLGMDGRVLVTVRDDLAEPLGLTPTAIPEGRKTVVEELIRRRAAERDRRFAEFRSRVNDVEGLLAQFSTCIRCHNCMVACPICYCKECIARTTTFDHEPRQYFEWAERKGVVRMPVDTLMFHLTRLNHMATSCVGCGMCTSACPNDIPVSTIFRAVGEKVQAIFDYVPGRSLEEELPLATFREDELTELGEK
ncbi:MAG: 4Fe-4S dicluster domain-containing protein [Anaerolineae bacterium]|jgi:formate dehydrogenase subunit beta|nr:4Fe-4S dicluster domain-containing protein [Anaerolineae bacterium]MDH7472722.1 4Fe-4S dicluster domain-containing protein [Anaerolineae bacterium]